MVNPISFGPSGINSQADFSPLAQLGSIYQKAQQDAANKAAFAAYQQTGDPSALLASGDMNLARLGVEARNHLDTLKQQQIQNARADKAEGRAQYEFDHTPDPEDTTPTQRAALAAKNGLDPKSPEGRQYILSGTLPANKVENIGATIEARKQAAIANGLDPSSPGFQSFVLTGKMPREDAQPLTSTDKKAILEADEHVQTNQAAIDSLKRAKELSPKAYSGVGAGVRGVVGSQAGLESAQATEQLENEITSNALGQLKAIFGGAPTEGERKILLDIQGSTGKPDAVRQGIYDRAQKAAEKRLEFNRQRADALRGGSFYKPQGGTVSPAPPTSTASSTAAAPATPPPSSGVTHFSDYFK
jgi:hypothetical protein